MNGINEVLAAQSTILAKLGVYTVEEVQEALARDGWNGVYELIDQKYNKLIKEGKIKHEPRV